MSRKDGYVQWPDMLLRAQLLLTAAVLLWLVIFLGRLLVASPTLKTEAQLTAKVERQPVSAIHRSEPAAKPRRRSPLLDRPPRMLP